MHKRLTVFFAMESFLGLFSGNEGREAYGGAEVKMYALATGLAHTGEVEVVLLTAGATFETNIPNISVRQLQMPISKGVPLISRFFNKKRAAENFAYSTPKAVLMCSQFESVQVMNEAKGAGVRVIYRINGDSLIDGSSIVTDGWRDSVNERIFAADYFITQSKTQKENLLKHYGKESTILESLCSFPAVHYSASMENEILWVGRCVPIKRPWEVLTLAKLRPQYHFVMLCPRENPQLSAAIYAEADELPNVEILNGVSREETLRYYNRARVVISTSWSEAIASTLIEASCTATPYVSEKVCFDESIVNSGIAHCADDSWGVFLATLDRLMQDDRYCTQESSRAFTYAQDRWNTEKIVQQHLKFFLSL